VGATAVDIPIPEAKGPARLHDFKGNMDTAQLTTLIEREGAKKIPPGDADGDEQFRRRPTSIDGQHPRSETNLQKARHSAVHRCVPVRGKWVLHQAARAGLCRQVAARNREGNVLACGWLHHVRKERRAGEHRRIPVSNDDILAQQEKDLLILTEGFPTYGGLAGRDLEAIAVGLNEALNEEYLRYRIASTAFLGNHIAKEGVPIVQPPGGHAIYLDARAFLPHIPVSQFPGVALAVELYLEGGIRSVEIGSLMFGEHATMDLVRLAIPRRVYTQSHIEYVVEVIVEVWRRRGDIRGYEVVQRRRSCGILRGRCASETYTMPWRRISDISDQETGSCWAGSWLGWNC
jgi:tryptophanase